MGDDAAIFFASHVRHRAHQEAAGAAAHGEHLVLRRIALRDQIVGHVDEIGEGVFLVHQLAVVIPGAAHFLAAADMGDGDNEAAVHQRDEIRAEHRVGRCAIGAVGVLIERRCAVALEALAVDQRNRHLDTVARRGPDAFGGVVGGVVAGHGLFLQYLAHAGIHIDRHHARGRGQRGVVVAQLMAILFRIDFEGLGIGRLVGRDHACGLEVLPRHHAQPAQAVGTLVYRNVVLEQFKIFDEHVLVVRDQFFPLVALANVAIRHSHDSVVGGIPIGFDHPAVGGMIGRVKHLFCARREPGRLGFRVGRIDDEEAVGGGALLDNDYVAVVAAFHHTQIIAMIGLGIDNSVLCRIGADHMLLDACGQ